MTDSTQRKSLISFNNVTREDVDIKGNKILLLDGISWNLYEGQRTAVFASLAREASAFLYCASQISPIQKGRIDSTAKTSWPIGLKGGIHLNLTGRENAEFIQGIYGLPNQKKHELNIIQELSDIEEGFFDKPIKFYNKFMRSRFYIALSLAFEFDVFIIPKFFAWKEGANSRRILRIQNELKKKCEGKAILMANTEINFTRDFCDHGIIIEQSRIIFEGSFSECSKQYVNFKGGT